MSTRIITSILLFCFMAVGLGAQSFLLPRVQTVTIPSAAPWALLDTNNTTEPSTYYVVGSFFTSNSTFLLGKKLGIYPDALTVASLAYANNAHFVRFQGTINPNDVGKPTLQIPGAPFLKGLTMYFVGITWNPFRTSKLDISPVSTVVTR